MSATSTEYRHGQVGYLQLPTLDLARSRTFYAEVFGWSVDPEGSFEAPGLIGQLTPELSPAETGGPVLWLHAETLGPTLLAAAERGGQVLVPPQLDQGERWLTELADPTGNRIGLVTAAPRARAQTLLAVADVEASSRWYQELLGLTSDHGGPSYERLVADGQLVLQLHHREVGHDHGPVADLAVPVGNGVLVWFGEVSDFDGVLERAERLHVPVVRAQHRNPDRGGGNGPAHREVWLSDPDGYTVVVASPDGEAWEGS